mgnify:CR=1 FL=1
MFCPFIQGECREDCTFRRNPRAMSMSMKEKISSCTLTILADELDYYVQLRTIQEEDHNS